MRLKVCAGIFYVAVMVGIVLANAGGTSAIAADPEGPRLAVVTHGGRSGSELITIDPTGESRQRVIINPTSERPSWSADGSLFALAAWGEDLDSVVAVARSDGSDLRLYRHAFLNAGHHPVMSPDGRSIAFSRSKLVKVLPGRENYLYKGAIFLLDVKSGAVRRLTRWRLDTSLTPSSFSPDGSTLAASSFSREGLRAVAIDLRGGDFSLLAREAMEPIYSPDGSRFAFVRYLNWRLNGINEKVPAVDELRIGRVVLSPAPGSCCADGGSSSRRVGIHPGAVWPSPIPRQMSSGIARPRWVTG